MLYDIPVPKSKSERVSPRRLEEGKYSSADNDSHEVDFEHQIKRKLEEELRNKLHALNLPDVLHDITERDELSEMTSMNGDFCY